MDEGAPAQHIREARPGGRTNKERSNKCDIRNTLSTTRLRTVHYGACAVDETLERITTILSSVMILPATDARDRLAQFL